MESILEIGFYSHVTYLTIYSVCICLYTHTQRS
jgi:hypothetical protein